MTHSVLASFIVLRLFFSGDSMKHKSMTYGYIIIALSALGELLNGDLTVSLFFLGLTFMFYSISKSSFSEYALGVYFGLGILIFAPLFKPPNIIFSVLSTMITFAFVYLSYGIVRDKSTPAYNYLPEKFVNGAFYAFVIATLLLFSNLVFLIVSGEHTRFVEILMLVLLTYLFFVEGITHHPFSLVTIPVTQCYLLREKVIVRQWSNSFVSKNNEADVIRSFEGLFNFIRELTDAQSNSLALSDELSIAMIFKFGHDLLVLRALNLDIDLVRRKVKSVLATIDDLENGWEEFITKLRF